MSTISARLNKLERGFPESVKQGRMFRVIAGQGDEVEARELLDAEGYDPGSGDLAVVHIIVTPAGQSPYSEPPHLERIGRPT